MYGFRVSQVRGPGHHMTKNWAKIWFWSQYSILMYQVATFVNGKDLSEVQNQRSKSPHDQTWGKIQF